MEEPQPVGRDGADVAIGDILETPNTMQDGDLPVIIDR